MSFKNSITEKYNMDKGKNIKDRLKNIGYNLLVSVMPIVSMVVSLYTCHIHERRFVYEGDDYDNKISNIAMYLGFVSIFFIMGNVIQGLLSCFRYFKESDTFMTVYRHWKSAVIWASLLIIMWCQ